MNVDDGRQIFVEYDDLLCGCLLDRGCSNMVALEARGLECGGERIHKWEGGVGW